MKVTILVLVLCVLVLSACQSSGDAAKINAKPQAISGFSEPSGVVEQNSLTDPEYSYDVYLVQDVSPTAGITLQNRLTGQVLHFAVGQDVLGRTVNNIYDGYFYGGADSDEEDFHTCNLVLATTFTDDSSLVILRSNYVDLITLDVTSNKGYFTIERFPFTYYYSVGQHINQINPNITLVSMVPYVSVTVSSGLLSCPELFERTRVDEGHSIVEIHALQVPHVESVSYFLPYVERFYSDLDQQVFADKLHTFIDVDTSYPAILEGETYCRLPYDANPLSKYFSIDHVASTDYSYGNFLRLNIGGLFGSGPVHCESSFNIAGSFADSVSVVKVINQEGYAFPVIEMADLFLNYNTNRSYLYLVAHDFETHAMSRIDITYNWFGPGGSGFEQVSYALENGTSIDGLYPLNITSINDVRDVFIMMSLYSGEEVKTKYYFSPNLDRSIARSTVIDGIKGYLMSGSVIVEPPIEFEEQLMMS